MSALHDVASDDGAASALLAALEKALGGKEGKAAQSLADATAFEWAPPALRASGAGPASSDAGDALAIALATHLSPKESVALLSGEVAASSGGGGAAWARHQVAALAALPTALARTAGMEPPRRGRLLTSALEAASSGLGQALRAEVMGGGQAGGGRGPKHCASAWWLDLTRLASGDAGAARACAAAVAADLGWAVMGIPMPLATTMGPLPRPAEAALKSAGAAAGAGLLLGGGGGGQGPRPSAAELVAAMAGRASALTGVVVSALGCLGFDPAVPTGAACPFLNTPNPPSSPSSSLDSEEAADAAEDDVAAAAGWAITVAATLCVAGCDSGDPGTVLARAAACVPVLLSAASSARAPGAVVLAAAAAAFAASQTHCAPTAPHAVTLLAHLTAAMSGVPDAPARNAAFHAWECVLGCLAPADRVAAAVEAADGAAAEGSCGVESLAIHHLAGMVAAAAGGGGGGGDGGTDDTSWRLAAPALLSTCTARLTPFPPPLAWADDLVLAERAEPVAAALAGLRLLLLLGKRPGGRPALAGLGTGDLAPLRTRCLLPLQAAAGRGGAALLAIGQERGEAGQDHESALALERVKEGVARVLELVEAG